MPRRLKLIAGEKKFKLTVLAVFFAVMLAGTFFATRFVISLREPDKLEWFQAVIRSMGVGGWFVMLAIQYVQIVVAFIPGGPIQMLAGAFYGPSGGVALCLIGTVLATATVFLLVSRFGHGVVSLFVDEKELEKYRFLRNEKQLELLVLLLFFIPGTPKDALTYLFAITPIKMSRFMLISTAARLPAVLASIMAGDSAADGRWLRAGIIFLIISAIGLAGMYLHRGILRRLHKKS